jgi:plastocyanin
MRLVSVLAGLGLLLGSLLFGAAPVAAGDPCYHGFDLPERSEANDPQIKMMPCAFAPTVVRVAPGTIVRWFNDLDTHLLTGANQEWGSRDDEVRPGEEVAYRFDRPGTYPYACALHRGMAGTIVVGDGISVKAPADAAPAVVQVKGRAGSRASPSAAAAAAAAAATVVPPPNAALATSVEPARAEGGAWPGLLVAGGVVVIGVAALAALAMRGSRIRSARALR